MRNDSPAPRADGPPLSRFAGAGRAYPRAAPQAVSCDFRVTFATFDPAATAANASLPRRRSAAPAASPEGAVFLLPGKLKLMKLPNLPRRRAAR